MGALVNEWPAGYGRRVLAAVDSTNAEAARVAGDLAGPAWILARRQTAGRGRRGRAWADPVGNFAATLVMRPTEPPQVVALRSFVAALALDEALVLATGRADSFALKWPNDVLLNGGKVAGILLESAGIGQGTGYLAIGFGVNLRNAPEVGALEPGALRPVSLVSETGVAIGPEEFLPLLATAYDRLEQQFVTYGFEPIRAAWLARAARLGEQVTARIGTSETVGSFETIDGAGNLILKTARGRQAIPAADIFF